MRLGCFGTMVQGVVGRLFMMSSAVVLGGFPMVLGGVFVMIGRLVVMFSRFLGHGEPPTVRNRDWWRTFPTCVASSGIWPVSASPPLVNRSRPRNADLGNLALSTR